jgi:hypothetical protein
MEALIGGTPIGKPLEEAHVQIYGWIDAGGNVSSATHGFGGNAPVADSFTQNTVQLDQAVVYIERVPDTVQKTSVDWGFRFAPIYGENYRYTTALGPDRPAEVTLQGGELLPLLLAAELPFPRRHRLRHPADEGGLTRRRREQAGSYPVGIPGHVGVDSLE